MIKLTDNMAHIKLEDLYHFYATHAKPLPGGHHKNKDSILIHVHLTVPLRQRC